MLLSIFLAADVSTDCFVGLFWGYSYIYLINNGLFNYFIILRYLILLLDRKCAQRFGSAAENGDIANVKSKLLHEKTNINLHFLE